MRLPRGLCWPASVRSAFLVPFLVFLSLALPSAAQGFATIYEHPAGIGPTSLLGSSSVTIRFSDGVATDFECQLDGGSWTACADPKTYAGLADGPHNFGVRTLGDTGVATYSWVTDTTGPVTTLESGPQALTTSKSATIAFDWTDLHTASGYTECSLDAQPYVFCASPYQLNNLSDGQHTLSVIARDTVANASAPVTWEWTIDTTPPDTQITSKPNATTYETSADFGLDSFPEAGPRDLYECSLDGADYSACGRSKSYTGLAPGSHTFSARAIDRVGLVDPTPATWTWTVLPPAAVPDTTITEGPSGTVGSTTALFRFNSSIPATYFECSLDGSSFVPCSEGYYTDLSEGSHTFAVRAVNSLGTPDSTPATRTWTVNLTPDTTPPDTTITAGHSGTTSDPTPTFEFTSEPGATFQCRIDAGAFSSCSSPETVAALTDGAHTFEVRATDAAMNPDPTPASRTFTVDSGSGPPVCSEFTTGTPPDCQPIPCPEGFSGNQPECVKLKAVIGKLSVTGPAGLKIGSSATYKVQITNSGNAQAAGVKIKVSGNGVSASASFGSIPAGSTKTVKVKLKPKKTGKIKAAFKVTSSNAGGKTVTKTIAVRK
ncbi:MAG: large repetitive protein [Actinomycetota bacterium]|nr:large repetitive protein [Actinomycetota bacterium]